MKTIVHNMYCELIELIHRINRIPLYIMYLTLEAIALYSLCGHASLIRMSLTKEHWCEVPS